MFEFFTPLADLLSHNLGAFVTTAVIIGLLVGSFLNVVIHRIPKMMENAERAYVAEAYGVQPATPLPTKYNIVTPRSACPNCGHQISAIENIPIVSWLMLGGKCKGCKANISARYPLVEALTGALMGLVAYQFGFGYTALFAGAFTLALIALTFIDFDTQFLPDDMTLPLLWLGLLFNLHDSGFTTLKSAVIGAVAGYLILWSIYWLFKIVTGKEGMGYGDFKLLGAIGAWFGWQYLPAVILLSSVVGTIIGIGLIMFRGKNGGTAIPFGPFLALGGIAALFFGKQLLQFYLPG